MDRLSKLAREMTHTTRAPIESLRGQDPLTDWAIGMQQRATSPLATLAGEARRFQGLSPEEMGMELMGGGVGSVGKQSFKELMKAAEQAMIQKQVQKQHVKLRDLMAVGGALPAGVAGGYYGMGYMGDDQ